MTAAPKRRRTVAPSTKARLRAAALAGMPKFATVEYTLSSVPPSVNHAFYNRKSGGRGKSHEYKKWRVIAGWDIQNQVPKHVAGWFGVDIRIGTDLFTGDLDNRIKGILDVLVDMMIVEDDRKMWEISVIRTRSPTVVVRVYGIREM